MTLDAQDFNFDDLLAPFGPPCSINFRGHLHLLICSTYNAETYFVQFRASHFGIKKNDKNHNCLNAPLGHNFSHLTSLPSLDSLIFKKPNLILYTYTHMYMHICIKVASDTLNTKVYLAFSTQQLFMSARPLHLSHCKDSDCEGRATLQCLSFYLFDVAVLWGRGTAKCLSRKYRPKGKRATVERKRRALPKSAHTTRVTTTLD